VLKITFKMVLILNEGENEIDGLRRLLREAVEDDNEDQVRLLLEVLSAHEITLRAQDLTKELNVAVGKGFVGVCKALLENGASANLLYMDSFTPITEALISGPILKNDDRTVEILQLLIQFGAEVNLPYLIRASRLGLIGAVTLFVDVCSLDVNRKLTENHLGIGEKEDTALHKAVTGLLDTRLAMVKHLLSKGAKPNLGNQFGQRPLHIATDKCGIDVMEALLIGGADIEAKTDEGDTPLMRAINYAADETKARWLIARGADVNAKSFRFSETPLMSAAAEPSTHVELVEELLSAGADVNHVDENKCTALHLALIHRPNKYHKERWLSKVRLLARVCSVQAANSEASTALHLAAAGGLADVCATLLDRNACLSAKDISGQTPLARACQESALEAVALLLNRGAKVNARDKRGRFPLHSVIAATKNIESLPIIVELLLKHEADANVRDAQGFAPLHRAIQRIGERYPRFRRDDLAEMPNVLINVVKQLVERGKADVDAQVEDPDDDDREHVTPTLLAAKVMASANKSTDVKKGKKIPILSRETSSIYMYGEVIKGFYFRQRRHVPNLALPRCSRPRPRRTWQMRHLLLCQGFSRIYAREGRVKCGPALRTSRSLTRASTKR
jgi:ankyrin repeat protein